MPYIEVETIPEGMEEADVIPRADYDSVVGERDSIATQRDEALAQIESANKAAREAQSKYAELVLGMGKSPVNQEENQEHKSVVGRTISGLFRTKGD